MCIFPVNKHNVHTIIYQLTPTITFSKTNCAATIQGWLLNLCGEFEQWSYVAVQYNYPYQLVRTYLCTATPSAPS